MRITNQIIDRRALDGIQRTLAGMEEAHLQVTTGLRVRTASDDPGGYVGVLSANRRLAGLEQYRRNISSAESRMALEESALDQLGDVLSRARELAISQAGANGSTATRLTTKGEVDQLLAAVVSLGNTRHGDGYLFGGDFDNTQPFAVDGSTSTTTSPVGSRSVEYAPQQTVGVGHDGMEVFVDSGVIASLRRLSDALGADSDAEIAASLGDLGNAFARVQDLLGETGARTRHLEVASANIEGLTMNLRTLRADLSEVDLEEAISQLVSRQTTYQAALNTTARLMSTNLNDYLR